MFLPQCPKCHKPGVVEEPSKFGGTFLANYEWQQGWAKAWYRGVHTPEECEKNLKAFEEHVAEQVARQEAAEAFNRGQQRAKALINRYAAIYGKEAVAKNYEAVAARWLKHW